MVLLKQIDELVKAVRPKSKSRAAIEQTLHALKDALDKIRDEENETEVYRYTGIYEASHVHSCSVIYR